MPALADEQLQHSYAAHESGGRSQNIVNAFCLGTVEGGPREDQTDECESQSADEKHLTSRVGLGRSKAGERLNGREHGGTPKDETVTECQSKAHNLHSPPGLRDRNRLQRCGPWLGNAGKPGVQRLPLIIWSIWSQIGHRPVVIAAKGKQADRRRIVNAALPIALDIAPPTVLVKVDGFGLVGTAWGPVED